MVITLFDRSMYLKGLLLLIRQDREIHQNERHILMRIGEVLGFEKKFCENAITEVLGNKYIIDEPPRFANSDIAKCFIKDGLRLALVDGQFHKKEVAWLRAVAQQHSIEDSWYELALKAVLDQPPGEATDELEAGCLEWA